MGKKDIFTKILAVLGTLLIWGPVLAPLVFGLASLIGEGVFRFDFLFLLEVFLYVLMGEILLIWAALRARRQLKLISWALGVLAADIILGFAFVNLTGLATSTDSVPTSGQIGVGIGVLVVLYLAVIATGVGGILLIIDLFKRTPPPALSS